MLAGVDLAGPCGFASRGPGFAGDLGNTPLFSVLAETKVLVSASCTAVRT